MQKRFIALLLVAGILLTAINCIAAMPDEKTVAGSINKYVGNSSAVVVKSMNETLVLKGTVSSQYDKEKAEQIARTYTSNVKNMIEVKAPESIKLEARVYAVDLYKTQALGVDWGTLTLDDKGNVKGLDTGAVSFGQGLGGITTLFDSVGMSNIGAMLEFLTKNGAAQVIAQPSIITASGSIAEITIGGEIVTPTVSDYATTGDKDKYAAWKGYGIKLHIEPTIMPGRLVNTRIAAEVSNIQWSSLRNIVELGNGNKMPSIKQTQAETISIIPDGKYLALGGLLSNQDLKATTKIPFLGDIPVLGWLFKSEATINSQQEVVILVQPKIIENETFNNKIQQDPDLKEIRNSNTVAEINDNKDITPLPPPEVYHANPPSDVQNQGGAK